MITLKLLFLLKLYIQNKQKIHKPESDAGFCLQCVVVVFDHRQSETPGRSAVNYDHSLRQ